MLREYLEELESDIRSRSGAAARRPRRRTKESPKKRAEDEESRGSTDESRGATASLATRHAPVRKPRRARASASWRGKSSQPSASNVGATLGEKTKSDSDSESLSDDEPTRGDVSGMLRKKDQSGGATKWWWKSYYDLGSTIILRYEAEKVINKYHNNNRGNKYITG